MVYVTHDQVEAMTMATRIAILADGRLQQVGTPSEVYHRPANLFVARFIGSPQMNTFDGTLRSNGNGATVALMGTEVSVARPAALETGAEQAVTVGVRAEHLHLVDDGPLTGSIRMVEELGHENHVVCDVGTSMVSLRLDGAATLPNVGDEVRLAFDADSALLFDSSSGARIE
jgi:ABC-type sugar transport system ATPase subunit